MEGIRQIPFISFMVGMAAGEKDFLTDEMDEGDLSYPFHPLHPCKNISHVQDHGKNGIHGTHDEEKHRKRDRDLDRHVASRARVLTIGRAENARRAGCRVLDTRLRAMGLSRMVSDCSRDRRDHLICTFVDSAIRRIWRIDIRSRHVRCDLHTRDARRIVATAVQSFSVDVVDDRYFCPRRETAHLNESEKIYYDQDSRPTRDECRDLSFSNVAMISVSNS